VDFGTTPAAAAGVISAFALGYGLMQLVSGILGDRYGKFRVVACAAWLCTVAAILAAVSPSLPWLRASRFVAGATAAGIVPLTMAWIGDNVPYARRQEVLARLLTATVGGMIAGQWLGGLVADTLGWRVGFAWLAALFAATGGLFWLERRSGATAVETALTTALATDVVPSDSRLFGPTLRVLGDPWPRRLLAITFVEGALAFGPLAFIPAFLHLRFGLSMASAGAVLALFGAGGLAYSRSARQLLRWLDEKRLAALGGVVLALSFASLALIEHWQWAMPICAFGGFGLYALHGTLQTRATQMAPAMRGTAMSLFACVLFLGQSLGVLAGAWTLQSLSATPLFAGAAVGLVILAAVFVWQLGRHAAAFEGS